MAVLTLTLGLASCTTEKDNPAIPALGNASVKVNVAALYEELGITNVMQQVLGQGDWAVEGRVLIYDEEGNLIKELSKTTKQLTTVSFDLNNLPNGTYTLVGYQSINESDVWKLVDKEKLSTVKLSAGYLHLYYYRALGLVTQTVTINGNTVEAELTPKAAGAMIDLRMDRAGYNNLMSLSIQRHANAIFLDPARSEEDRLEYDLAENLSSGYLYEGSSRDKYFVLASGDMNTIFWYLNPDDDYFWAEWWDQPISLRPGAQLVYYYDKNPQLFYKTYVGPAAGFEAWQAKKAEERFLLKPIAPYGASQDELKQYLDAAGIYYYYFGENEISPRDKEVYYNLNSYGYFDVSFLIREGEGLVGSYYNYYLDDIQLSQVEAELTKIGYQLTEERTSSDGEIIHFFELPGTGEVLMTVVDPAEPGWWVFFTHSYLASARQVTHKARQR